MMEYYFAYGSNMDREQIQNRCPSATPIGKAVLRDHQIGFTRYSKTRECGVADILVNPGQEVWGILYTISKDDLKALDIHEGVPNAYRRNRLDVWKYSISDQYLDDLTNALQSEDPSMIDADPYIEFEKLEAHVYEVVNKSSDCYPDITYLDLLLDAAYDNYFPGEYIEQLASFGKKDIERRSAIAIDHLLELKEIVMNDRWPAETQTEKEWGGAQLVITGCPKRKQELNKHYPNDLVIYTPHWQKMSWLLRNIYHHPAIKWQINGGNKYGILEELGLAMAEYQVKNPNDNDIIGLAEALIQKVYERLTH